VTRRLQRVMRVKTFPGAPVISVRIAVLGGARSQEAPGQCLLAGRALSEGTARRDWARLAEDVEARGMSANGFAGWDVHGVAVDALVEDGDFALEIAAEMLLEPTFPEDRCRLLSKQAVGELASFADQGDVVAGWAFLAELYRGVQQEHPMLGTVESLERLRAADIERFHRRGLEQGLLISVTGAIDEDDILRRLEASFGPAAEGVTEETSSASEVRPGLRRVVTTPGRDQAHVYVGQLTVARSHPDLAALEVLSVILGAGAGLTGRIPERVREDEGLAYTSYASAVSSAGLDRGRLVAYAGTSPATVERAEDVIRQEFDRLLADGVTDQEVADAKAYLIGRDPFRRETARQWADLLIESKLYGEPVDDPQWTTDRIAEVDRGAVEAAARKWVRPEEMVTVVGLPES
jgi:zinc protease